MPRRSSLQVFLHERKAGTACEIGLFLNTRINSYKTWQECLIWHRKIPNFVNLPIVSTVFYCVSFVLTLSLFQEGYKQSIHRNFDKK